jgi:hypothetical protein
METRDLQRLQIIERLIGQQPQHRVYAAISMWEQLAKQIISIIGEEGFNSLYARSVVLTQATFPWLEAGTPSSSPDNRFADLKTNLEAQMPAQANSANKQLLISFTDILATLIGEGLTTRILDSAWSNDLAERATKGFIHE